MCRRPNLVWIQPLPCANQWFWCEPRHRQRLLLIQRWLKWIQDATFDYEYGGIIMNDGPIKYDEFNIPITMRHLSMGGRYAVFGFYRQLTRPFKKYREKLRIIYVLCSKSLYSTNYYHWTWVKCASFITNNNTNLLWHLDNKHSGVASVKTLVSNKKKKSLMESVPATVQSIGSIPNTHVTLSIYATMNKFSVELVKCGMFCWLVGSRTPFEKKLLPKFCHIFKLISGYTRLSRQTWNTMVDEDYA